MDLEKEIKREEKIIEKSFKKLNVWVYVSAILAVVLIAMILWPNGDMSAEKAGEKIVNFLNANVVADGGVTLKSVSVAGSLYQVNVSYQGQEIPIYTTKDGGYFIQSAMPTDVEVDLDSSSNANQPTPVEVPKTDKPKSELYIWSYCPYGVQAQGPLAEVADLLSADADFEIVPYYDGHGAYETQQNNIQLCIQKNAPSLYWKYAAGFAKDIYPKCGSSRDVTCDADESIKLMKSLGIDSTKIMDCVTKEGDSLFQAAAAKAQSNGVTGSPTLIINGVVANSARNAEAYKSAICNAFTDAPDECSTVLDSSAAAASGNC